MALILEANILSFPNDKPYQYCSKDDPQDSYQYWEETRKKQSYSSKAEVHMIKLGPITEEFLTRKKLGWFKAEFGIDFELTDAGDYKWTSGEGADSSNAIPLHQLYKLKDVLKSMGYVEGEYDRPEKLTSNPVNKIIFSLQKKF